MSTPAIVAYAAQVGRTFESLQAYVASVDDLRAHQLKQLHDEVAELRDEVHLLATSLVSAGIPLVDPPPLRSVS